LNEMGVDTFAYWTDMQSVDRKWTKATKGECVLMDEMICYEEWQIAAQLECKDEAAKLCIEEVHYYSMTLRF